MWRCAAWVTRAKAEGRRRGREVIAVGHATTTTTAVTRILFLVGLGQDGDVLRARSLGDGHDVDRLAQKDVLVAA